jgi:ubiquinol-cytochrome c reductase cytochrome c subunit
VTPALLALLLAAAPGAAAPLARATPAAASLPALEGARPGGQLYATYCASCHGAQAWGTADGPSLRGVGLAAVDFYLTTGRMPAAVPWLEVAHRDERSGQALPLEQIRAIEDYLAPAVAGGPAIPQVVANGNLERGRSLYALHCEHCHAVTGEGGAIGGLGWAPPLQRVSINQVADAIRVGPGEMPQFGEHQLDQDDLNDVASYVVRMEIDAQPRHVPPFRSSGPVPEGAVGYLAVIALVAFVFTFWRVDTPPREREEAVRRDEGGRSK